MFSCVFKFSQALPHLVALVIQALAAVPLMDASGLAALPLLDDSGLAALQVLDDSGLAALQVLDQGGHAGQGEIVGPMETVREYDPLYLSYFRQLTSGDGTQLERRAEAFTTPKVIQSGQTEASEDLVSKYIESGISKAFKSGESGLPEATQASELGLPEARGSGPPKAFLETDSELLHFSQARELGLPHLIKFEESWLLEAIPDERVRTPRGQPRPLKVLDTGLGQDFRTIRGRSRPRSQKREPHSLKKMPNPCIK